MFLCRIREADCDVVKVIGRSLHDLEQLYLGSLKTVNFGANRCLVTGCPKLKILYIGSFAEFQYKQITKRTLKYILESVQYLLLGLPDLIELKHPYMVVALEKLIRDGRTDIVSSLRTFNIHIDDVIRHKVSVTGVYNPTHVIVDVYDAAKVVINHLINITKLTITLPYENHKNLVKNLSENLCTMIHLTELSWRAVFYSGDTIFPIIETLGHQLKLLDLYCGHYSCLDVINQCRELRVLRIHVIEQHSQHNTDPSYGSDLHEQFTPFQHLQKLDLNELNHLHFKPALLKSLIASPVLQDLKLWSLPIFTDHILKAAFAHINEEGEHLAFTSLRKLELVYCDSITSYLWNVVTDERVPLEMLTIKRCSGLKERRYLWHYGTV